MCACTLKHRKFNGDAVGPVLLFGIGKHLAHIVSITKGNITFSRPNRFDLRPVVALRFAGQIGFHRFEPIQCVCFAMVMQIGSGQSEHIRMRAGAGANTPPPFGICEIFVACDFTVFDARF